jgi:translocon-associated protein subunit beta
MRITAVAATTTTTMMMMMMMMVTMTLVSVSSGLAVDDDQDPAASLMVTKSLLNKYVVEGMDVTVQYTIYNVGTLPAFNVKLDDSNFPKGAFKYVTGFPQAKWPKISPATNVTHIAVVRPIGAGNYDFTSAQITYFPSEKATKPQVGHSSELGSILIQEQKEYQRRHASHTIDWILFVIMAAPSICIPYSLWWTSSRKWEAKALQQSTKKSN